MRPGRAFGFIIREGWLEMLSLSQRILKVLAESPLPITTPDLVAIVATGLSHPRARVWTALGILRQKGLVVCEKVRTPTDGTTRIWSGKPRTGHPVTRWKLIA